MGGENHANMLHHVRDSSGAIPSQPGGSIEERSGCANPENCAICRIGEPTPVCRIGESKSAAGASGPSERAEREGRARGPSERAEREGGPQAKAAGWSGARRGCENCLGKVVWKSCLGKVVWGK
jgi:hypothetical protein